MEKNIKQLAHKYAVKNTTTRCLFNTENCKNCEKVDCDYRARYIAFLEGYAVAKNEI